MKNDDSLALSMIYNLYDKDKELSKFKNGKLFNTVTSKVTLQKKDWFNITNISLVDTNKISILKNNVNLSLMNKNFSFDSILSNFSKTAINIGNTKYVKASAVGLSSKTFSKEGGGLSGKSLYSNTLRMVKLVASKYDLPIIATGGVSSYDNVKELLDNGASLTGMATLLVSDPFQIPLINYRLSND